MCCLLVQHFFCLLRVLLVYTPLPKCSRVHPLTKMFSWMEVHPGKAALNLSWDNSVAGEASKNRTLNQCSHSCV